MAEEQHAEGEIPGFPWYDLTNLERVRISGNTFEMAAYREALAKLRAERTTPQTAVWQVCLT